MAYNTMTRRLLALQAKGAIIKVARAKYEGQEAVYSPRWSTEGNVAGDPYGWVLKNDPEGKRFSGGDLYACY
jgi:hypothetical protein